VPDEPAAVAETPARRTRRSPCRRWLFGAGLVVGVAALAVALLQWGAGGSASRDAAFTAPHFVDDTSATGIVHRYAGGAAFFEGGGVAAFDCDGDGRSDLFFAGGSEAAALYRNRSPIGGALRFAPVASPVTDLPDVTGAYPLDIDGDGHEDLVVLRHGGGNVVLRGLGDCRFERANEQLGLDGGNDWTTAFSATWEGSSTLPTMAFGAYRTETDTCGVSKLLRPAATGHRYAAPIALSPGYCTLSMLFSDWDRSGRRDLRMSNDRNYYRDGQEQLWRVAPGEVPREYTEADGWRPLQIWGMGIASQDLTGDGYPEVFLTSQGDNKLQTLADGPAQPTYEDMALRRGVTAQRPFVGGDVLPSTAWHPEFADVNNDGLVDLLVTKGNVEGQIDYATRDPSNLLLGQADGTFVEGAEAAGIVDYVSTRGAALVDLNLDGLLDLVEVHRGADVTLWRNVGRGSSDGPAPMGHWISVGLKQPAPNVDAVGAWVEVRVGDRTTAHEITVGGGHAGGQIGWIHTGLGDATGAEVRVQWPDGELGPWTSVPADEFLTIERGVAGAARFVPEG
jgi:enediyne biosynthesis protein E4